MWVKIRKQPLLTGTFLEIREIKKKIFTSLKEETREMCKRGGEAAQLPSGPLTARFTKISNNAQDLHCYPLALSRLTLLRFLPLFPGHFSLSHLLRFVGVQRVEV